MTTDEIDDATEVVLNLLKVGADFYPPLAFAVPILASYVRAEAVRLKSSLAAGTIVSDGRGGFLPHGMSIINPLTGQFTGEKT